MVKNYFYLIVGVLSILFAVTHTLNGTATVLPVLNSPEISDDLKTTFTYVWHLIGIENLIFGIALLIMAFQKARATVKFTAWLIMSVLGARWIIISVFTLLGNSNLKTINT
jgi:hypothetical protein